MQELVDRDRFTPACATALWQVLSRPLLHSGRLLVRHDCSGNLRTGSGPTLLHAAQALIQSPGMLAVVDSTRSHLCPCTSARRRRSPV